MVWKLQWVTLLQSLAEDIVCHLFHLLPPSHRSLVGDEGQLVPVLQMLMKSSNEAAMEAALCLGFLRPGSSTAREFLLQCLCQGPKTQQMKVGEAGLPGELWGNRGQCWLWWGLDSVILIPEKRSFRGLCVFVNMYMHMGSCGHKCTSVCVYFLWLFIYVHLCAHMNLCSHSRGQEARERTPPVPHEFQAQLSSQPGHTDAFGPCTPPHHPPPTGTSDAGQDNACALSCCHQGRPRPAVLFHCPWVKL